jgi:hypothetical protein
MKLEVGSHVGRRKEGRMLPVNLFAHIRPVVEVGKPRYTVSV